MLATFPIYFTPDSEKQYGELCRQIDIFEAIWESVVFGLKKNPSNCGAKQLKNGLWVKNMSLRWPHSELWIVFEYNDSSIIIQGIKFQEDDS